ncbi:unnamed protein product [Closterium sp. NIES-64]|nr:unnamed protein product [Closterium sp. NIES-64]
MRVPYRPPAEEQTRGEVGDKGMDRGWWGGEGWRGVCVYVTAKGEHSLAPGASSSDSEGVRWGVLGGEEEEEGLGGKGGGEAGTM